MNGPAPVESPAPVDPDGLPMEPLLNLHARLCRLMPSEDPMACLCRSGCYTAFQLLITKRFERVT